jgi:hypothetical protein
MKLKSLLALALIGLALLAASSARDIERYLRLRNM